MKDGKIQPAKFLICLLENVPRGAFSTRLENAARAAFSSCLLEGGSNDRQRATHRDRVG
jgi:hypothetical protein